MFLRTKGLKIPDYLQMWSFDAQPSKGPMGFMSGKPKHLVPLGDTPWPEDVKADIVAIFKELGVENPLKQKLVEPYAKCFGGRDNSGEYDLADVNWEMAMDYFKVEVAQYALNGLETDSEYEDSLDEIEALQRKAEAKYGDRFNHRFVYEKRG